MTNLVGFHSAREMVRVHTPFDTAVAILVDKLQITPDEAIAAMHAAHESIDWGIERVARDSAEA